MSEARQFGVDRMVLARLVNDAALDDEAARLGLSAGDAAVRRWCWRRRPSRAPTASSTARPTPSRSSASACSRARVRGAAARRDRARADRRRGAVRGDDARRSPARPCSTSSARSARFDWLRSTPACCPSRSPAPTDADARGRVRRQPRPLHPARDPRDHLRRRSTPEALAATIEVPEDELRAAYDADARPLRPPERRIADRIGFGTTEEAAAALARIDAGEIDFDALAAERGLTPERRSTRAIVTADELSPEAADAVFGADGAGHRRAGRRRRSGRRSTGSTRSSPRRRRRSRRRATSCAPSGRCAAARAADRRRQRRRSRI